MEDRFDMRLRELLEDAELHALTMNVMLDRLRDFVRPFAASLTQERADKAAAEQHFANAAKLKPQVPKSPEMVPMPKK